MSKVTSSGKRIATSFEHDDHPDCLGSVGVEWIGNGPCETFSGPEGLVEMPELEMAMRHQTHALIYTDGYIAITMYECCYAMFVVRDGSLSGGNLWKRNEWQLTKDSMQMIRKLKPIE